MTQARSATWVRALQFDDLRPGRCKVIELGGQWILLTRVEDEVHATDGLCSHVRTPLGPGRLSAEGLIECPMHGALFSPLDGSVQKGPAKTRLSTFATRVVDGVVDVALPTDRTENEEDDDVRTG